MKKRIMALFLAVMFSVIGMFAGDISVQAEELGEDVDISYILTDDALIGYAELRNRGIYLSEGFSTINDAGGGKIGCGGVTNAAVKCQVSVNSIVERKVDGSWVRVTSWTNTRTSAYTVSISKYLSVTSGYYYRVRSTHHASTDGSSSWTAALWM